MPEPIEPEDHRVIPGPPTLPWFRRLAPSGWWPSRRGPVARPLTGLEPLGARRRPDAEAVIGVVVYQGVTTAEIDVPVQRLADRLGADVRFVGPTPGRVAGVEPPRLVVVDASPDDGIHPHVLVVPGGLGWRQVADDESLMAWLRTAATDARAILAMSTGSLLLAATGLLSGHEATGHWLAQQDLADLGANVVPRRVADSEAGRVVTAAGALAALQIIDTMADRAAWADLGRQVDPPS